VAHKADGKVVFIEGALPFEYVSANINRKKNNWEQGTLTAFTVNHRSACNPACPHFGLHEGACGGCKMQHLHPSAQVAVKQRVLEDNLWHLGKVKAEQFLRPLKARPGAIATGRACRCVTSAKKARCWWVFMSAKAVRGRHAGMPVLPPHVDAMLMPLRKLIKSMDAVETCPQIELACGDSVTALVLRHLEPLSTGDLDRLRAFAAEHPGVQWWLQPKGPETVQAAG
jgi:23S rRNA (uracil1939-C5)-methyltransferase